MKKIALSIVILLSLSFSSMGAHIIGGEVYYDYLGNDQYKVTFEIYRDCQGPGAAFDNPLNYTVFNDNGTLVSQYAVLLLSSDTLPVVYDDPCVTPPSDICVQRGIYVDTITLPATPEGYYIVYQRCCWTASIQNIVNPGDWGLTIAVDVPGTNLIAVENNAARFDNFPPIVLCSGQTLDFDHAATDPDGDSLVYNMCTPPTIHLDDQAVGVPTYDPEMPEPYQTLGWEVGITGAQPFGPGSNISIDSQTGFLNLTPLTTGMFVAAVCVEEWRNGVLINSKMRTFGYRIVNCEVETPMQVDVIGATTLIEDCGSAGFIVVRDDSTESVDLQVFVSGTATNGVDYNSIGNILTMPIGVLTDTITITPYLDGLVEGDETIIFNIVVENICEGTFDTTTAYITIQDYFDMILLTEDSINVCDDFGEIGELWCSVANGVGPYGYYWAPLPYADNDTLTFPATDLNDNLNIFSVSVVDQCGKIVDSEAIFVYNQCPLHPPNIITANGDNINDFFIIKNLYDYDRVQLQIFNRWGNVVFETENYQNDWDGKDMAGHELVDGTYFYTLTPESIKYEYDDQEKTLYSAHGFVQIVRD
ncbi:MAG: gliding motility-associated C-terminal domain-containing protein [Crocinitomicaceae bacterium]|nr:gliding motility-associated C-terminal domain-containing protein [Crocinitomicaceae bacterium]